MDMGSRRASILVHQRMAQPLGRLDMASTQACGTDSTSAAVCSGSRRSGGARHCTLVSGKCFKWGESMCDSFIGLTPDYKNSMISKLKFYWAFGKGSIEMPNVRPWPSSPQRSGPCSASSDQCVPCRHVRGGVVDLALAQMGERCNP